MKIMICVCETQPDARTLDVTEPFKCVMNVDRRLSSVISIYWIVRRLEPIVHRPHIIDKIRASGL